MCLKEELRLLNLLSERLTERLKRDHYLRGTELTYALSNSPISGDDQEEEKGLYHVVIPFCDFNKERQSGKLQHCNPDYVYIKIGKRFRHANRVIEGYLNDKFVPYFGFLKMSLFQEYQGQLLGRCSDGYAYELPLDTLLYVEHRKLYEDLDRCVKLLKAQLCQR